jgi:predicted SAM-dependent methyltransferase
MVRQSTKDVLFGLTRWACRPSTWVARWRFARPTRPEGHYVHLGCGPKYVEGMINCDGNRLRRIDAWIDLRNRLPFRDRSVAFVWMSHTLEHLYPDDAIGLLMEIRRVLTPDGVARIAVPSFAYALRIAGGEAQDRFPRAFDAPDAQAINHLFVDGQHKFAYSFSVMQDFAGRAGFARVGDYSAQHGETPKRYGPITVGDEPKGSLIVELSR